MDPDKEFVASILRGGEDAYRYARDKGITEEYLVGDGCKAWEYVVAHRMEFGNIPSAEVLFGRTGIDVPNMPGAEGFQFWVATVLDRRLFRTLREGTSEVVKKLDSRDPKGAGELWTEIHRKLTKESLTMTKVESLLALGKDVLLYYDNMKAGVRGIPTPWPTMTDQTGGWWPEDLGLIAARLGQGKTWSLLLISHCAWKVGKKVLFVSTEMNKVRIAMRFFAINFKIPYGEMTKGRLGEFAEKNFRDGVLSMLNEQGLTIVGGGFDFTVEGLEGAVDEAEPDLMALDGPYLIKNRGKDRHEVVSNTFDDCKRINRRKRIATITNSQFNRTVKKGSPDSIAAENIGITDVVGWNMDVGFGLNQSDDMYNNGIMGWKPIKIREGRPEEFWSKWDMNRMDFAEINEDGSYKAPPEEEPTAITGKFADDLSDLPDAPEDDTTPDDGLPF